MFLIGLFGIVLTALPDMFPFSEFVNWPVSQLNAGFVQLAQDNEVDAGGHKIGVLRKHDAGYEDIYGLLRFFRPSIPRLKRASAEQVGDIYAAEPIRWGGPNGNVTVFRPILVHIKELDPHLVPVCDMRDLAQHIHDRKVSFWSRLGSALTIAAFASATLLQVIGDAGVMRKRFGTQPLRLQATTSEMAANPLQKSTSNEDAARRLQSFCWSAAWLFFIAYLLLWIKRQLTSRYSHASIRR